MLSLIYQHLSWFFCLDLWSGLQYQKCWSLVHQGRTNTTSTGRDEAGEEEPLPSSLAEGWGPPGNGLWLIGEERKGEKRRGSGTRALRNREPLEPKHHFPRPSPQHPGIPKSLPAAVLLLEASLPGDIGHGTVSSSLLAPFG